MIKNEKNKILIFLILSLFIYISFFILDWSYSFLDTWEDFEIDISESYFFDGTWDWVRSQRGSRLGRDIFASVVWFLLSASYWMFIWKYRRAVVTKIENLFSKFMSKL